MRGMDMDAHRRRRLQDLVDKETGGNVSAYARNHGQDATRLRQILNPNYRKGRSFGEGTARRLEADLGLPSLYFDLGVEGAIKPNGIHLKHKSGADNAPNNGSNRPLSPELTAGRKDSLTREGREKFDQNVTPAQMGQRRIPIISYVQAGMMTEVVDPFALGEGFDTIEAPIGCSPRTFGLKIEGKSMEPRFHEGDVVIIDPEESPRPGDFVAAKNGKEEATFKKYRPRGTDEMGREVFELVPLNDDFPTLRSDRDGLIIIGVCIGRWETFR